MRRRPSNRKNILMRRSADAAPLRKRNNGLSLRRRRRRYGRLSWRQDERFFRAIPTRGGTKTASLKLLIERACLSHENARCVRLLQGSKMCFHKGEIMAGWSFKAQGQPSHGEFSFTSRCKKCHKIQKKSIKQWLLLQEQKGKTFLPSFPCRTE